MSIESMRKKYREKAKKVDASMGSTYIGTSMVNAVLGDNGKTPYKTVQSNNPTAETSAPTTSYIANRVKDIEQQQTDLKLQRAAARVGSSNLWGFVDTTGFSDDRLTRLDEVKAQLEKNKLDLQNIDQYRVKYDKATANQKYETYETEEKKIVEKYGSVDSLLNQLDAKYAMIQNQEAQLKKLEEQYRQNPSNQNLSDQYDILYKAYVQNFDDYQSLYGDLTTMQTAFEDYDDYSTAAKKGTLQRMGQAAVGSMKKTAADVTNALATAYETGQQGRTQRDTEMLEEAKANLAQAQYALEVMMQNGASENELQSQRYIIEDYQRKVDGLTAALESNAQVEATAASQNLADRIAEASARDIQIAKQGLDAGGQFLMDATVAGTQLALDVAAGKIFGLGSKVANTNPVAQAGTAGAMYLRGFGGAAMQARQAGANLNQQVAYGLASATLEVLTERISSAGKFQVAAFGPGKVPGVDKLLTGVVNAVESKAKTVAGRKALNRLASMATGAVSEGLEEAIAAAIDPVLQAIYSGEVDFEDYVKNIGYDALIGAVLGAVGGTGGTDTSTFRAEQSQRNAEARAKATEVSRVSDAAAPEVKQMAEKEQLTKEANPEADVLDTATTMYLGLVEQQGKNSLKKARNKADIVQRLVAGEKVEDGEINALDLTSAKAREVFTQLTGVQFPDGSWGDTQVLRTLARSAHTVAQKAGTQARVETQQQQVQAQAEQVAQQQARIAEAQATQAQTEAVDAAPEAEDTGMVGPDNQPLVNRAQFEAAYLHRNPMAAPTEIDEQYGRYLMDNATVTVNGERMNFAKFKQFIRSNAKDGDQLTESELADKFAGLLDREAQNRAVEKMSAKNRAKVERAAQKWEKVLTKLTNVKQVVLDDTLADDENAYIDSDGVIHLNAKRMTSERTVAYVIGHELVHSVKDADARKALVDDIIVTMRKLTGASNSIEAEVKSYQKRYQNHENEAARRENREPKKISYGYAEEEYAADLMRAVFLDSKMLSKLAGEKPSLIERAREIIDNIRNSLLDDEEVAELRKDLESLKTRFTEALKSDASKQKAALEKAGVAVDTETESAYPDHHSLATWLESDYVQDEDAAATALSKALSVSPEKAAKYIQDVNGIAKIIADNKVLLDYDAAPGQSSFVSNAEYGGSIDFSTICKKRRLMTGTFSAIQRLLPNTPLSAEEMIDIRRRMKAKGYEVSCGLCYVEGSRLNLGEYAAQFLDQYQSDGYTPELADLTTADGQETLRLEHPEVYEAYIKYLNSLAQRKPKVYQTATAYNGEILKKFGKDGNVKAKNENGGLRLQSFSDFEIIHLIDNMQVIMDMARVGLAGQAYTKVPDFAWALGNTGLKINLSLIAKDVDADGHLVFDDVEGMPHEEAKKLRDAYSDNVGTIIVVFNDAQLKAAMADDFIDYIIPFHRSQLNKQQYEGLGLPEGARDYTLMQNESYIEPVLKKNGKKDRPSNYMPNTYWDFSKTGKENAEAYLKMCAENNRRPKFSNVLEYNGDGSYSLPADGSADGYWKLLIDFKMYNNEGVGVPQQPVKPEFNIEQANRMLNEYKGGHSNFPVAQDIVDAFVEDYKKAHPEKRYSLAGELAKGETDEKYWRPKINRSEWELINYRKNREFDNPAFDIDADEKWLYAKEKGVTVFALYSKHDPDDPTVTYAAKGKNAEKKYEKLLKFMEDKKNANTQSRSNRNGASIAQWAALIPHEGKSAAENLPDDGRRGADAQNVPVYGQESIRVSRTADEQSRADHGRTEVTEQPGQASEKSGAFNLDEVVDVVEESDGEFSGQVKYSLVADPGVIEKLENDDYMVVYKAMQVIDGELYPPMSAEVEYEETYTDKKGNQKTRKVRKLKQHSILGRWQQSDEAPDAIKSFAKPTKKYPEGYGQFDLLKGTGNKKDDLPKVAYNPYEHTSNIVMNDQFSTAYKRDNLVTVEYHIPMSEVNGIWDAQMNPTGQRYQAQYAKDPVGLADWKAGGVAQKLKHSHRDVYLTRWSKPIRVLDDAEVARKYKEILDKENGIMIPWNVVTPSLRHEMEKIGVPVDYSDVMGSVVRKFSEEFPEDYAKLPKPIKRKAEIESARKAEESRIKAEKEAAKKAAKEAKKPGDVKTSSQNSQSRFSLIDSDYMAAVERGDMETAQRMVDEAAKAAGYKTLVYHGSPNNNITVFDGWRGVSYFTDAKRYADAYAWNTESGERILSAKRARKKLNNRFTDDASGMPMEFDAMDSVAIPEDYDGETGKFFADGNSDAIYYASGEDEYKQVAGWHTEMVLGEMPVATKENTAKIKDLKSHLDTLWTELDRARKAETEFLRTFMSDGGNVENAAQEYARLYKQIDSIGEEINATEREIFQLTPKRGKSVLKVKRGVGEAETEFRNEMQQIINAANGAETPRVYRLFLKMQNPYISHSPFDGNEFSARFNNGSDVEYTDRAIRKLQKLKDERYDGVIAPSDAALMNAFDDDYWEDVLDYIVFDSKQVKSADPVTYDDNGNVIPLSERFNTQNPDIRYSITPAFEKWYAEQFGEEDVTNAQLKRRLKTYESRAEKAERSARAAEFKRVLDTENNATAWRIYHEKTMRAKTRQFNEKLDAARKEKTEAVRAAVAETKMIERAKAEVQHDADRMAERRNAAKRLRTKENAYQQKIAGMKENFKLKRNAAKATLRDAKLAEKRRNAIETEQGLVNTIRQNPKQRTAVEKLHDAAAALRVMGRSAYRNFVNQAAEIDAFSKRQVSDMRAGTLVNIIGGASSTMENVFKQGLVDRAGNRIGESMSDVFLCWDDAHKNVDENMQALLQDFMLHWHNIDRMSIESRAASALETFENTHEWLRDMDSKEFARLVAMTEKEVEKSGKYEAQRHAIEYARLIRAYNESKNKPIFADDKGNPVTASTSQVIVNKYLAEHDWLLDKANGIYEWWDKFMREWAVGDTITEAEYNRMREMYPHYVPTYRADKNGVGGANFVGAGGANVSKAVKRARGGTSEVMNIEDSFSNLVSKIIRLNRVNELYMNIIDTAMLDGDGLFSDMAFFDWDSSWQSGEYEKALELGALLNDDFADTVDENEKAGLEKVGDDYKLTGWLNGRKYTAFISEALYKSIGNVTGHLSNDFEDALVKVGNTLTGPMKTAITGINPTFAIRNLSRDLPTAIVNSISGMAFPKYYAKAAAEIAKNSEHWQTFQALGGTHATYYNDNKGFVNAMTQRKNPGAWVVEKLGTFNEITEAQTRFAEYLATIDRLGDTYENRLQGIKNAAEVTVDFSRKGRYGKSINAWVPYWNPAVQGVDKVIRSVIDSPDGAKVWKQATKTLGRAAMTSVLTEAVLYSILKALDRDDEWEELNDRTKDTYYCIPLKDSKKFLKIPKNREWGAIFGTPFMRILEWANGREDPFENYIETAIEPNFLPPAILRPDAGGGFTSDVIGFSWMNDLAKNEDFAGRTIVPYAYQQGSLSQQFDSETSWIAKQLGEMFNWSPMQIDYIVSDYFGDFGDLFIQFSSEATWTGEQNPAEAVLDTLTSPFVADARYSNYAVSKYYDTMEELGKVVQDKKNQLGNEAYKQTVEYQTEKAVTELYGDAISDLNRMVRELPDGPEKDNAKYQIAALAKEALQFYEDSMAGKVTKPILTAQYYDFSETVSKELIAMDSYSDEYKFKPTGTPEPKYPDPRNKNKEFVLTDDQKDYFKQLYREKYDEIFARVIQSSKYKNAKGTKKAEMLEIARTDVLDATKEEFFDWLRDNGVRSTKKQK